MRLNYRKSKPNIHLSKHSINLEISPSEGTPPYSIILYYGMLVKPLDKMYPVGCDDLGAPYQTVGTICIRIRAHLTISWADNDRPYGITVADEFTCGAPGSYPRAPSLALRAIHLGAPYGINRANDKNICHKITPDKQKRRTENPYGNSPFSIFHSHFFSMSRNTFGK